MTAHLDNLIDAHCKLQDVHFEMEKKYEKLLEFVKYCAELEVCMQNFVNKYAIDFKDDFNKKATKLLRQIGESHE